jgi:BirA family biotin operon repressor/biotin-[acetyl-CoA-carboxylase] ligase
LIQALDIAALPHDRAVVGQQIHYHLSVGSTNDLARQCADRGDNEGVVVLAEEQTSGRGRMGRAWTSPPGCSLLLSLLLRPAWMAPEDAFALTMLAGTALCEAVEQVAPLPAALKWPNDLMLPVATAAGPALRKAAGILSEIELDGDRIAWVVIGIGVNVNWAPEGVADGRDLRLAATSVSAATGRPIDRSTLLRWLLARLDARYLALRQGRRDELFEAWRGRLATLGQPVHIRLPGADLHGIAESVEPSGALRVRDERGELHTIVAGDVGG